MREPTSNHDAADMLRESALPHVERAVLTEIALHWPTMCPSLNRIIRHTGIARRTAIYALQRLEEKEILEIVSAKETGEQRLGYANRYSIRWEKVPEAKPENTRATVVRLRRELARIKYVHGSPDPDPDLVQEMQYPSAPDALPLVQEMHYNLVQNLQRPSAPDAPKGKYLRKTNTLTRSPRAHANAQPPGQCEAIYAAYPRHKGKHKALAAIAKVLMSVPYDDLLATVKRYATKVKRDGTEERFVPHPATWFNAGSYEDDDLKPPVEYDIVEVSPEEWEKGSSRGIH